MIYQYSKQNSDFTKKDVLHFGIFSAILARDATDDTSAASAAHTADLYMCGTPLTLSALRAD